AVFGLAWEYSRCRARGWKVISWGSLVISLGCLVSSFVLNPTGQFGLPASNGYDPPEHLWFILPALCPGLLVCPPLDLTFHRVRREAPGTPGTRGFLGAFLGVFPVLVGYTLLYARVFLGGKLDVFVLVHIAAQSAMTVGAHIRELREHYGHPQ